LGAACASITVSRLEKLNCALGGIDGSQSKSDCGSAFGPRCARAVESSFCNSAHFVKEFPDFGFELSPAFLHAIQDVGLHARTIHLGQVIEKVFHLALNHSVGSHGSKEDVRQISQRRSGQRNAKQFFKRKSAANAEAHLQIERARHSRKFGHIRSTKFFEKVSPRIKCSTNCRRLAGPDQQIHLQRSTSGSLESAASISEVLPESVAPHMSWL
jgi:hypothetical protein